MSVVRIPLACIALACATAPLTAAAAPITTSGVGYWLDTIGTNSIGIAGGGSAGGTPTTLFIANTTPGRDAGTTASTVYAGTGVATGGPGPSGSDPTAWARRVLNPTAAQLGGLEVTFRNGADSAVVVTPDLLGRTFMPLATSFTVGGDPYSPLLQWTLPTGVDIDRVQLVFHNDDTNLEIGTRVTRLGSTLSYQLMSVLPERLNIVFDLRLVDLDDRIGIGDFWQAGDILSMSRTYVAYSVPARVPEPATAALVLAAAIAAAAWRRRRG